MDDEKNSATLRASDETSHDAACDAEEEEKAVEEVMKWLDGEASVAPEEASPFVTINGNEESCGPSFSDAASTVMASLDTRGAPGCMAAGFVWPWTGGVAEGKKSIWPEPAAAAGEEKDWLALLLKLDKKFL